MCNGLVFYMKKQNAIAQPVDFYYAMQELYALNQANNTKHVQCTKSTFEDVNPVPGEDKECWCDERS